MQKSISLEKLNGTEVILNARNNTFKCNCPDNTIVSPKRKFRRFGKIFERYCITIKPKLYRSNSLSELTTNTSDFTLDFFKHTSNILTKDLVKNSVCCGDSVNKYCTKTDTPYMSWNLKGKKTKRKNAMSPETYASKFTADYVHNNQKEEESTDVNLSSGVDSSSTCSIDQVSYQKVAAFPFKSTPSGNLKVQSNQVVFQSSTVGVLLADPTQAKVKVKFEGKTSNEINYNDDEIDSELQLQYGPRETTNANLQTKNNKHKTVKKERETIQDSGKELRSLGYTVPEPIDWMRIQLPKKQDLFQEFYRRIHNHVNTDTIIHIGDEEIHCHRIVLQIYSTFFDVNPHNEIELPISSVTPEAFQTIYNWMIFSGPENNKLLKRDNILDIFCAAQYLHIKDLEEQCWSFIVNENLFSEDSAFALFLEAREKGITPVIELMIPRVMKFFLPLVASKDFLELDAEEVMTILKSNYICVTSEIEVLMAGVRWLYADWPPRSRYVVEVMRCVKFGLISPWQLVDIKRNPDNAEILEIVNKPEVQQMVDDGLAYVIIKYWYGNNSKNYYHWIDVLGLSEPAERNWIGEEKNHVTYKDFLEYLEQFMVPKDQMYQQMAMMQPPRRNDDVPGNLRGIANDNMEAKRRNMDFPLPTTLKGLSGDKEKFSTMSDFLDNKRKGIEGYKSPSPARSPVHDMEVPLVMPVLTERKRISGIEKQQNLLENDGKHNQIFELPEKDSTEELNTSNSESDTLNAETSNTDKNQYFAKQGEKRHNEKRHSVAASYLAAATAALSSSRRNSGIPSSPTARSQTAANVSRPEAPRPSVPVSQNNFFSPQLSLFNQSKESLARNNMNKLSTSILGPSNKNYITEGSLFNWDRETVLVFGGIDPHNAYGAGRNTGKSIYRYDPVLNVWDYVGDLPEPRHHHSIAFLRGRIYLVGGADPRDDDIRGKSVVVSTVWSYEPVTRSWYSESGLAIPRKNFGLVVHRMALYAIGGQDKKGRVLRSVERFDPKTGSWSEVRCMSVARMAVACVKYREYIWVAGGMTGEKKKPVCKIVECYNSKTNEWTEIHNLRFPRCFATLFAMNDKLYIIGGAGKKSDKDKTASSVGAIDVWDWKDRAWKHETDMSIPRHGHALAYLGTQLIILGGMTTIYMRALNNVESFCCERGAWIRGVATLPSPLSGHGAVTLPPASLM
ncbi:uncharacterized protein LOC113517602 isoform X1 [Galleria mellonella]|uniref:Uncharacterized protein LOC113517602 isoform X1 n=1 Tax=Galleria mellonella TaxID=7137 RepID=A0ABM3N283_GALME|nr:uncharacterized protein LOC113517602 isoform X1 [Galleria mellonella]